MSISKKQRIFLWALSPLILLLSIASIDRSGYAAFWFLLFVAAVFISLSSSANADKTGDAGKPHILIILPVYLMLEEREPFKYQPEDHDSKLGTISIYTLLFKIYCYNKLLLSKFRNDVYFSTIIEKQRAKIAVGDLGFSEHYILLMRMFQEIEQLHAKDTSSDLETLVAIALIKKEKEFEDIKNDDERGSEWMMKIANTLKLERAIVEKYFEGYWTNSGFNKTELQDWLSDGNLSNQSMAKTEDVPEQSADSKYHLTYPATVDDALAAVNAFKDKTTSMSQWTEIRHMLTDNIRRNLYERGSREEGRRALKMRDTLDETFFNMAEKDLTPGPTGETGLSSLRKAIVFETAAEHMEIIERAVRQANGDAQKLKLEMSKIADDQDNFGRFSPQHRRMIKDTISYSSLEVVCNFIGANKLGHSLARRKIDGVMRSIAADTI